MKGTIRLKGWWPCLMLMIALTALCAPEVQARNYAEIAAELKSARQNIEAAEKSIEAASQKVSESIAAIRNAESFEGPHWNTLDQSVKDWAAVMEQAGATIDTNARTILRLDPSASVRLRDSSYFGVELRGLRDQLRGVQTELQGAIARAEQTRQRQAQIRQGAMDDIKDGVVNLTLNAAADVLGIPTSAGDAAGSVVLKGAEVAGHWFAKPIGLAHTGIKFLVGFYYLADEAKSGARVLRSAADVDAFAQEFINRTRADIASAQQGIEWVEKLWSMGTETRNKFTRNQSEWRSTAEQASKQQAQNEMLALEEAFDKPTPSLKVSTSWCAAPLPDIDPSEYKPEADAILRELRSAAMAAAFDGGSPLAYHEIKEGHMKRLYQTLKDAENKRNAASATQRQAITDYLASLRAIDERLGACWRACGNNLSCRDSCYAASRASKEQACAGLRPASTALHQAGRDLTIRSRVLGYVSSEGWALDRLIMQESVAARNRYSLLFAEHEQAFDMILAELLTSLASIPSIYALRSYENVPQWADRAIDTWMNGSNVMETRNMIAGQAERIREAGDKAKQALTVYNRVLPELQQAGVRARAELDAMQNRLGPLLYYDYTNGFLDGDVWFNYGVPRSSYTPASIEQNVAWAKQRTLGRFSFVEPENVAAASRFPYESTARAVESRLGELDDLIARLDIFNFRLSNLNVELDKVSRALTGKALYSQRENSPAAQIASEFSSGQWGGFARSVSDVANQYREMVSQVQRQHGIPVMSQPNPSPRQELMAFQAALLSYTNQTMANYIRVSQHGGFLPVEPEKYEQILTAWNALKPLYDQHESLAAPARADIANALQLFPDESNLHRAVSALPRIGQSAIALRYNSYRRESEWLRNYATRVEAELRPVNDPQTNDVMARLQALVEGYPVAKEAWERRQAEQIRQEEERLRQEEARRKAELEAQAQRQRAEEAARLEREQLSREAVMSAVPKLYQDFVDAYGRGDLRGLMRLLASDWRGGDGADLRDVEEYLTNSFRVFDRIQYRISGFSATPLGEGRVQVKYSVRIVGENRRQRLEHEERSDVVEEVGLIDGQARILRTLSGTQWLR